MTASQPTYLTWMGVAKEATRGTAVPATDFIPVKTITPQDVYTQLPDEGMRGSAVKTYDQIQGVGSSTFDFSGDYWPAVGYIIAGMMGEVATTGGSAPYTHAMTLLNTAPAQPKSYTLTDFDVINARQYPGSMVSDFTLKFSADGMLEYDAKAVGWLSAINGSPPSTSYDTTFPPIPSWRGVATIGGSAAPSAVDGEVDFKRPVTVIHTLANTQQPYRVFAGPLEVTGKLSFTMEDETEYARYLTSTSPALDLTWSEGATTTTNTVTVHSTAVKYTNAQIQRGKDYVELSVDFFCKPNSTDVGASGGLSPCKVTLLNAHPASTFA